MPQWILSLLGRVQGTDISNACSKECLFKMQIGTYSASKRGRPFPRSTTSSRHTNKKGLEATLSFENHCMCRALFRGMQALLPANMHTGQTQAEGKNSKYLSMSNRG